VEYIKQLREFLKRKNPETVATAQIISRVSKELSNEEAKKDFEKTIKPGFNLLDTLQTESLLITYYKNKFNSDDYIIGKTPKDTDEYKELRKQSHYPSATYTIKGVGTDFLLSIHVVTGHDLVLDQICISNSTDNLKSTILLREKNDLETYDGQKTEDWLKEILCYQNPEAEN